MSILNRRGAMESVRRTFRLRRARRVTSGRRDASPTGEIEALTEQVRGLTEEVRVLASLARTDPLTGLTNRLGWDEQLTRELARATRRDEPLSVVLLDLDDFKSFNDAHGHQAGDRLLIEAAAAWSSQLRDMDVLCRWGGDEFAILLPNCPRDQADGVIARLVAATPQQQPCAAGVTCWDGGEAPETLLARTDAALYDSKRTPA